MAVSDLPVDGAGRAGAKIGRIVADMLELHERQSGGVIGEAVVAGKREHAVDERESDVRAESAVAVRSR